MPMTAPSGTLTFLFTAIEDGTRSWLEHPEAMRLALARHDTILRKVIEQNDGYLFRTVGAGFRAAFHTAPDALRASLEAQQEVISEVWPAPLKIKVQMALHTCDADLSEDDYSSRALSPIEELLCMGYGGQIVLTTVTHSLVHDELPDGCTLKDLGYHFIPGLGRSDCLFEAQFPEFESNFPSLKELDRRERLGNLPIRSTLFIGREIEIIDAIGLFDKTRLLTLTGADGSGKTRLALKLADECLPAYPDGAWLIEVAPIVDRHALIASVARVLDITERPGQSLQHALVMSLNAKSLLLIFDSCDHLAGVVKQFVSEILQSCPTVKILLTSRESLGVNEEQVFRVPSLAIPDPGSGGSAESVSQFDAVQLFIARASLVNPKFEVTQQNAPALAEICSMLDGIPLAIELVSTRIRSLTVEEINSGLVARFRMVASGWRTALPRRETLRTLIDWSYDLLSDQEKRVLRRISVFSGSGTAEMAEFVCAGGDIAEWEVLYVLAALADKALVISERCAGEMAYRLLESVRLYALDRLQTGEDFPTAIARHREAFVSLAERAERNLVGRDQRIWLERLENAHDNIRSALSWCLADDAVEQGLRLAGSLGRFWYIRGYFVEGQEHLLRVMNRAESVGGAIPVRAKAALWLGRFAALHDLAAGRVLVETSLRQSREIGDKGGIALALATLQRMSIDVDAHEQARAFGNEAQQLFRELGERGGQAIVLCHFGYASMQQGDISLAKASLVSGLGFFRDLGNSQGISLALNYLGNVEYMEREYGSSKSLYEEALSVASDIGDRERMAALYLDLGHVWRCIGDYASSLANLKLCLETCGDLRLMSNLASGLDGLADLFLALGNAKKAAYLWASACTIREHHRFKKPIHERAAFEDNLETAKNLIGTKLFDAVWAEGASLGWEQTLAHALGTTHEALDYLRCK